MNDNDTLYSFSFISASYISTFQQHDLIKLQVSESRTIFAARNGQLKGPHTEEQKCWGSWAWKFIRNLLITQKKLYF